MSNTRPLIVFGATGKQGGGVISALLVKQSHPFEIYAVTRNKSSKGAQSLASKPHVHVVEGDWADVDAIFKQVKSPWGLFSVTTPIKGHEIEEQQGKAMTKAAVESGVQHIVFTSTERGGQIESENTSTNIPHFISKYNIEKDIIEKAKVSKQGTTWTFLRPVAFFENLSNDFFGKGFMSMWRGNGNDRKMQMISTKDIGRVAAEAFLNADKDEYRNKAISLAGDELTPNEAARIFKETTGQEIPTTFGFVGKGLKWAMHKELGMMFNWIRDTGFGADVKGLRQRYPFMQDFKAWLVEDSAWKKS